MNYIIIYLAVYPFLFFISFFRKNQSHKNLLIQTAKIGDYINTSVMFDVLQKTDIIIDKINYDFAKNDERIENIYIIQELKKHKIKALLLLYWTNYSNVYVVMPNSFNLFLAKITFAKNIITIKHYAVKWYEKILMSGMKQIEHTMNDLTVKTYLSMTGEKDIKKYPKKIPLIKPPTDIFQTQKFSVGISLTAGNKLKTIDTETWKKIFSILNEYNLDIYIFGLKDEEKFLSNIMKLNINNQIISLLGKVELKYLPYCISQMNLYISSDTGNSYIADMANVPLINFAGPCHMKEQKPLGKNVLIVKSNAKCTPFSFIFKAPYKTNCSDIYKINKKQEYEIKNFISMIYKDFQSSW